jgi:MoxR-like ATPase
MQPSLNFVPAVDENYFRWGNFDNILKIIESKRFYPLWITGLSGNGKTQMIEQACAVAGREYIRVNFTNETDESDLIGSLRLDYLDKSESKNVGTVFHEGPVVTALRRGAILLLDEVDAGHTNKILVLQSVLEGKGVLIKSTGEFVKPAPGFQVFATSNTKGRGSETGAFIGTNIMNGAFLDRFGGMMFQSYPPQEVEEKILKRYFTTYHWAEKQDEIMDKELIQASQFIIRLCAWADLIRKSYDNHACEEVITTRTLINIVQGFAIFGNETLAIELACERFDTHVKDTFLSVYGKLDDSNSQDYITEKVQEHDDIPF